MTCENCEKREAVSGCPCGCGRRLCGRCLKTVRLNLQVVARKGNVG